MGDALRRAPEVTNGLIAFFDARHDPAGASASTEAVRAAERRIERGLSAVAAIDEDRILRLIRGVITSILAAPYFLYLLHRANRLGATG